MFLSVKEIRYNVRFRSPMENLSNLLSNFGSLDPTSGVRFYMLQCLKYVMGLLWRNSRCGLSAE